MELTADNVYEVGRDCLFTDDEAIGTDRKALAERLDIIVVKGILSTFGFHRGRLQHHKDDVISMLSQLPPMFFTRGIGEEVINALITKDNEEWGDMADVELLFCLGIGLGLVTPLDCDIGWSEVEVHL